MTIYEQLASDIRETLAAFHPDHSDIPLAIDVTVTSIMRLVDIAVSEHVDGWRESKPRSPPPPPPEDVGGMGFRGVG